MIQDKSFQLVRYNGERLQFCYEAPEHLPSYGHIELCPHPSYKFLPPLFSLLEGVWFIFDVKQFFIRNSFLSSLSKLSREWLTQASLPVFRVFEQHVCTHRWYFWGLRSSDHALRIRQNLRSNKLSFTFLKLRDYVLKSRHFFHGELLDLLLLNARIETCTNQWDENKCSIHLWKLLYRLLVI